MASARNRRFLRKLIESATSDLHPFFMSVRKSHSERLKSKFVETSQLGSVFVVAIARPSVRNCVNRETAAQLVDAFTLFNRNSKLKVAVLHGKGGCFCAGYDLKSLSESQSAEDLKPLEDGREAHLFRPMGLSGVKLEKPVIAAIDGFAVAGGLELAISCDLRVVEENALLGVFCRRFGVPLLDGGTVRLSKLIGHSRAMDMIITGRAVDAKEALQFGLANRVVANGTVVGESIKLAQRISDFPQECMLADRRSANYAAYEAKSFEDAMNYEYNEGIKVITEESIPGARNFMSGSGRHGKFDFKWKSKL